MNFLRRQWHSVGVEEKLHIFILSALVIVFFVLTGWVTDRFEILIEESAQSRATETADGLINGMNMLMLTGQISNSENRKLLLSKMAQSKGIHELRIIRGKAVTEQFGRGMPSEQPVDDLDREVLATGRTMFSKVTANDGRQMLRMVTPFIAQENFRGTNCLACHHTKLGGVNGAASVTIDLSEEERHLVETKDWLWIGLIVIQIVLLISISVFVRSVIVRNITRPVKKLQVAMSEISQSNDLSKRADVDESNPDIGEMARNFNRLLSSLSHANEHLKLFAKMFESSTEGIIITDAENRILTVNPAFEQITQYKSNEVIGKDPKMLSSGKQTAEFYTEMWAAIKTEGGWSGEIWNRRKNGDAYPQWMSVGAVRNDLGQVINYIALFSDITQRKEAEQRIEFLAHYDSLTKLPNRALFEDRLQRALVSAKRNKTKVGLMFLDLDNFKTINDSLGHHMGDHLLQSVAKRLTSCVRASDTVCRQGGDEFLILLEVIGEAKDIANIAQKIMDAMSRPHRLGHHEKTVSFSIGAAIYPQDAEDDVALTRCADQAMYQAKQSGRNNFKQYLRTSS